MGKRMSGVNAMVSAVTPQGSTFMSARMVCASIGMRSETEESHTDEPSGTQ